jgi:hypothetical protein
LHWVEPFNDGLDFTGRCHVVLDLKCLDLDFVLFTIVGSDFSASGELVLNEGSSLFIVECSDRVLFEDSIGAALGLSVLNEVDLEVFAVEIGEVIWSSDF